MEMTEGEIKRRYNAAPNKKRQINILAELNACEPADIEAILDIEPEPAKKPEKEHEKEPEKKPELVAEQEKPENDAEEHEESTGKEHGSVEIINLLYERLDGLEQQIARLEEEYRKVTITIEVLSRMEVVQSD